MRKSLKIATVATVLLLALGAAVFVYASSQNAVNANNDEQVTMRNMHTPFAWDSANFPDNLTVQCPVGRMPRMQEYGQQWISGLSENATLSMVSGTVVSEVRGMLILDTGSGQVRIWLPAKWTVGTEVVSRTALFNGTFASAGQTVTVNVLENPMFSNANFSIVTMLGYEAVNATGTHAYAVLPFNIVPAS